MEKNWKINGDDDKYIKTRIKTCKDSIITIFYNKNGSKKIPEEKVPHKCLSIIILDSVIYAYEKYHPQIFLEECKYMKENIKSKNYIDMELESESDNDSDSDSDSDSDMIMIIILKSKLDSNNNKQTFNTIKPNSIC